MTEPSSNGGIYFHTAYQETGWPDTDLECHVNVSHKNWIKTGSLYGLASIGLFGDQNTDRLSHKTFHETISTAP